MNPTVISLVKPNRIEGILDVLLADRFETFQTPLFHQFLGLRLCFRFVLGKGTVTLTGWSVADEVSP